MLPLTTDMGRVLFAGNQMRRNIEIMNALCRLPELAITPAERDRLKAAVPRLTAVNNDRSRILHNPISGGSGHPYVLILHKQDGKGSAAMPISTPLILKRAQEAENLWMDIYINPVKYDLSKWGSGWPDYPVKKYPDAPSPTPHDSPSPKKKHEKKSEGD